MILETMLSLVRDVQRGDGQHDEEPENIQYGGWDSQGDRQRRRPALPDVTRSSATVSQPSRGSRHGRRCCVAKDLERTSRRRPFVTVHNAAVSSLTVPSVKRSRNGDSAQLEPRLCSGPRL